jgi:hypothetical protein
MRNFLVGLLVWFIQTAFAGASAMFLYFAWLVANNGQPAWRFVLDVTWFVVFLVGWVISTWAIGADIRNLADQEAKGHD